MPKLLWWLEQLDSFIQEKLFASGESQTIERIVKVATFYNIDEVKVETELRLLCSSQITHWAESSGELYNFML